MNVLRFRSGGFDFSQVSDAAGVDLQIVGVSPVATSVALAVPEDGDAEAVKAEMQAQGWLFADTSQECPILVSGDDNETYRIAVVGGVLQAELVQ